MGKGCSPTGYFFCRLYSHSFLWESILFFVYPVGVFYNLEPGRYRISQPFRCDGKNLELGADFEFG